MNKSLYIYILESYTAIKKQTTATYIIMVDSSQYNIEQKKPDTESDMSGVFI